MVHAQQERARAWADEAVEPSSTIPAETAADAAEPRSPSTVSSRKSKCVDVEVEVAAPGEETFTTVMIRNVPNDYTRTMLIELLDAQGFHGKYDFVYLPVDFKKSSGLGYAFVNFPVQQDALRIRKQLRGFSNWALPSRKVCEVGWSNPVQGLAGNIARFRNSPVMHEQVPDEYKPAIFKNGKRTAFPAPTKRLRAPQM